MKTWQPSVSYLSCDTAKSPKLPQRWPRESPSSGPSPSSARHGKPMEINQDFSDLFAALNASDVEYLVVGAHALAAHGHVRATKDIDVWVRASPQNAPRVIAALSSFGAPLTSVSESDFAEPGLVFQIGVPPVRIDILTEVDGLEFEDAWLHRVETSFGEHPCYVLSKGDLIKNKRASGRTQDLRYSRRLAA